jgi:hypothetical protein
VVALRLLDSSILRALTSIRDHRLSRTSVLVSSAGARTILLIRTKEACLSRVSPPSLVSLGRRTPKSRGKTYNAKW